MRTSFYFLLLTCLPIFSQSPVYVVGTVFDDDTGEPISYVSISTRTGKPLGKSNSRGRFEIEVEAKNVILVIKRFGFETLEVDLSDYVDLIDIEIGLISEVKEFQEKRVLATKSNQQGRFKNQSVEELEQFQGMRIDLNDHLRQLDGVAGMTEYSSDISVYGGRTNDVTHYLGSTKIPNMRHLDFGFPGNQSVLNPRLIKFVSVEDNLAKGPIKQGNSSALQYELLEGDPEYITGDVVFGTFNREFNATFYWDSITFIASYRNLSPTFLGVIGKGFFTFPPDKPCDPGEECLKLSDPIDITSEDAMLSIFKRRSNGGFSRNLFLFASDDFSITEDISKEPSETRSKVVQQGGQSDFFLSHQTLFPTQNGELDFSIGAIWDAQNNKTSDSTDRDITFYPFDAASARNSNIIGLTELSENSFSSGLTWYPSAELLGMRYSWGIDLTYLRASGSYRGKSGNTAEVPDENYFTSDGLLRFSKTVDEIHLLETSLGWHTGAFSSIKPLASFRYSRPLGNKHTAYGETAFRSSTNTEPVGINSISPYTTNSLEGKAGLTGFVGNTLEYSAGFYTRYYFNPLLPVPDVYWNYREIREPDFAAVFGTSLNLTWEPGHHFGFNLNGSIIQGDYYLEDGGTVPWEANRSLDFVSNFRLVPRKDSLLSFILTYNVNNGIPLYEYEIPLNAINQDAKSEKRIKRSTQYPSISRQRTDLRINLNLRSKWKPLETVRFFFQGSNLFAPFDDSFFSWLGGSNRKQRGWTRLSLVDERGELTGTLSPVLIGGLGLFVLFGFDMNFSI